MFVTAYSVKANGLLNVFSGRKKWTITCGHCSHIWVDKVPIVDVCSSVCPCCKTQNRWSVAAFLEQYNARIEEMRNNASP